MSWRSAVVAVLLATIVGAIAPGSAPAATEASDVAAARKLINQAELRRRQEDLDGTLAKLREAEPIIDAIANPTLRYAYSALAHMRAANTWILRGDYKAALAEANLAAEAANHPESKVANTKLAASIHHARGAALYLNDDFINARVMFELAAREGDRWTAKWVTALNDRDTARTARAEAEAAERRNDLPLALKLYSTSTQKSWSAQADPGDTVDRAIGVALRMKSPPPVPAAATQHYKAAQAALKRGGKEGLAAADSELISAILLAPWVANFWSSIASVEEQRGETISAQHALFYYLRAAPNAADRKAVTAKIFEMMD